MKVLTWVVVAFMTLILAWQYNVGRGLHRELQQTRDDIGRGHATLTKARGDLTDQDKRINDLEKSNKELVERAQRLEQEVVVLTGKVKDLGDVENNWNTIRGLLGAPGVRYTKRAEYDAERSRRTQLLQSYGLDDRLAAYVEVTMRNCSFDTPPPPPRERIRWRDP